MWKGKSASAVYIDIAKASDCDLLEMNKLYDDGLPVIIFYASCVNSVQKLR